MIFINAEALRYKTKYNIINKVTKIPNKLIKNDNHNKNINTGSNPIPNNRLVPAKPRIQENIRQSKENKSRHT